MECTNFSRHYKSFFIDVSAYDSFCQIVLFGFIVITIDSL